MNPPPKSAPSSSVGKILVLGIFGIALAAASFALYWNMSRSRRALAFWGPDAVRRIQKSDRVEILPLEMLTDEPSLDSVRFDLAGRQRVIDVTKARGLIHARHALTTDASYEPGEPTKLQPGSWTHAVRFTDQRGTTVLLLGGQRVGNLQGQQELKLIPKVADGWRSFVERQTKSSP
jgi:hypothetical protein